MRYKGEGENGQHRLGGGGGVNKGRRNHPLLLLILCYDFIGNVLLNKNSPSFCFLSLVCPTPLAYRLLTFRVLCTSRILKVVRVTNEKGEAVGEVVTIIQ